MQRKGTYIFYYLNHLHNSGKTKISFFSLCSICCLVFLLNMKNQSKKKRSYKKNVEKKRIGFFFIHLLMISNRLRSSAFGSKKMGMCVSAPVFDLDYCNFFFTIFVYIKLVNFNRMH